MNDDFPYVRLAKWVALFCLALFCAMTIVGLPVAMIIMGYLLYGWKKALEIEAEHPDIRPEDWLCDPVVSSIRLTDAKEAKAERERAEWRKRVGAPEFDPFE